MKCKNCGRHIPPGKEFCEACGTVLSRNAEGQHETSSLTVIETEGADELEVIHPPEAVPEGKAVLIMEVATSIPAPARGTAILIIKKGPESGSRLVIEKQVTSMGRHPESDIFLDDITVSRRHAEIRKTGEGFEIADTGSLNGTYVNRERIERSDLRSGDEIQIGKFKMLFFGSDTGGR